MYKKTIKRLRSLPKIPGSVVVIITIILLSFLVIHCSKEPIKGWDFYYYPPPEPYIASLDGVIKDCVPPYPVSFYHEVKNLRGNVAYYWDFGDGNTSFDKNPTHFFSEPGDYTIKLIVSNEIGADTVYLAMPALSEPSIPVEVDFSYQHFNENNYAPNKALFENRSSGANQFEWYFGDGEESNHDNPEHVYQENGTYEIKLRGTCSDESYDEATQSIYINSPPKRIFIDSINLMLPSTHKYTNIFIEVLFNNLLIGETITKSTRSYPIKFYPEDFYFGNYFFDNVQYSPNESFRFAIFRDRGEDPPEFLYEITLPPSYIQNNFYSNHFYELEAIPYVKDVFIDLYLDY